jgi:hypothetical protein
MQTSKHSNPHPRLAKRRKRRINLTTRKRPEHCVHQLKRYKACVDRVIDERMRHPSATKLRPNKPDIVP